MESHGQTQFACAHVLIKLLFLSGEPGVPGRTAPAGPQGPKGIQGESGKVGETYIRWGKKTCPNTGATLVYEGKNILFVSCHREIST
jgi:hypothetical protein